MARRKHAAIVFLFRFIPLYKILFSVASVTYRFEISFYLH